MVPTSSLFLPPFGEDRVTKNSLPAYCEWAMGSRVIDIITSDGELAPNDAFIKNARRQPVLYQLQNIKNSLKASFIDTYKTADLRQTRDTCPFNINGRIVYKVKTGSAYTFVIQTQQDASMEKSRISLEKDWEKTNIRVTIV